MNRRQFVNVVLGGSFLTWLASVAYPIIRYLLPLPNLDAEVSSVRAASIHDIPVNSGKIFKFGGAAALLVRKPSGEFVAFSAKCTHLDCNVQYRPDMERIWCACHNGQYDLNGINMAGPPPRPLQTYKVHVRGEDVYVTREA